MRHSTEVRRNRDGFTNGFGGAGSGALLVLICAVGIRKGTVGMAVIAAVLAGIMAVFVR